MEKPSKIKIPTESKLISLLFIGFSILISAGILVAANLYYDLDTGQVIMEEIQKSTRLIKATAGLIVGADQSLPSGVILEVSGSNALRLSGAGQELRFTGGTSVYIGFKAPTTITSVKSYYLPNHDANPPAPDYVLTWQSGDQLTWKAVSGIGGVGDITGVGDVSSGEAFTQTGTQGTSLWFYDPQGRGQLTIADLTSARTYTLPDLSGTITLSSGSLGSGGVVFSDGGLVKTSSHLSFDELNRYFKVGSAGNAGQIQIFSSVSPYYLAFAATSTMAQNTVYYWPSNYGSPDFVLTTDGSGNLIWKSVSGVGGLTGSGTAGRVAKWTGASSLGDSSIVDNFSGTSLTIDSSGNVTIANNLIVSGSGGVTASLYTSNAALTIKSSAGNDIILDPSSGKITLSAGSYIKTNSGYEIGKAGTQIFREVIPILGFDLPVRCSTACADTATTVSRTIEDYPFSSPLSGTQRKHKFIIRYADNTTSSSSTWTVWNETTGTSTATFTVPPSPSTSLDKGVTYITPPVTIPTNTDDWHLRVQVSSGVTIQIYQIFLAAYDEVQ